MLEKNINFVEAALKEYYFNNFELIHVPSRTSEREFGYQKFNSGMTRHLTIKNDKDLHFLLMTQMPSDVYCSNACYSFPNLPMSEKDWKEAELIFDIDAKDLKLDCRKNHTCFKCNSCQCINEQSSKCIKCNSDKFDVISVTCQNCISETKKEVQKLVQVLTEDLAINKEKILVYFSGNEGFHVHIENSEYQTLDSRERADLADYIMFNGVIPETLGINRQNNSKMSLPDIGEKGWRGRVAREIFGTKSKRPKIIQEILLGGYSAFQSRLEEMRHTIGVRIDPKVTMDIHRIFRLGGSINSKSGLSKILCKDLENFDPFSDACLLGDEKVEVLANCPISFRLKNKKYGPYVGETISVPKHAAVYMICKGLADVTQ
ncbi:MAG TPA: DNA primase small subunit domain-containing protein [Nitrosopumilaceae archaeon]|jgi:DNA primase small subunit|nr:DNA primase small subunit domain-containing protein [Nitrosopumilaceae archaeon]